MLKIGVDFTKRNEFSRPDEQFNNYLRILFPILLAGGFEYLEGAQQREIERDSVCYKAAYSNFTIATSVTHA